MSHLASQQNILPLFNVLSHFKPVDTLSLDFHKTCTEEITYAA
jgi:hypothetical protein